MRNKCSTRSAIHLDGKQKKKDKSPENIKLEQRKYSQPKIAETRKNCGNYRSPISTNPSYLSPRLPAYRSFRILLSTNHLCTLPLPSSYICIKSGVKKGMRSHREYFSILKQETLFFFSQSHLLAWTYDLNLILAVYRRKRKRKL